MGRAVRAAERAAKPAEAVEPRGWRCDCSRRQRPAWMCYGGPGFTTRAPAGPRRGPLGGGRAPGAAVWMAAHWDAQAAALNAPAAELEGGRPAGRPRERSVLLKTERAPPQRRRARGIWRRRRGAAQPRGSSSKAGPRRAAPKAGIVECGGNFKRGQGAVGPWARVRVMGCGQAGSVEWTACMERRARRVGQCLFIVCLRVPACVCLEPPRVGQAVRPRCRACVLAVREAAAPCGSIGGLVGWSVRGMQGWPALLGQPQECHWKAPPLRCPTRCCGAGDARISLLRCSTGCWQAAQHSRAFCRKD
jgi:hypothetical protein